MPFGFFSALCDFFPENFFVSKGSPPFIFYFFNVTYNTGRASRVPPLDFFRHCATFFQKFFNVPKRSPSSFLIFCNGMYVNKSRRVPLFTFFGTMRLFLKEKNSKISIFFQKNVLRFLSLRYGSDFRRSCLVSSDHRPHTDRSTSKLLKLLRPSPVRANLVQRVPVSFFTFLT